MTTVPPYQVTVTAVKRRGRGRKTIELKTFEYDKANRMWVYEPRKLKEKFYDGANADDFISAMLSKNHGRLVSGGTVWPIGTERYRSWPRTSSSMQFVTPAVSPLTSTTSNSFCHN